MPEPKYLRDKTKFINQRFGRWTVIDVVDKSNVLVQCDCGSQPRRMLLTLLRRGKSKRCQSCVGKLISELRKTHGESKTRLYKIWRSMYHRCKNPIQESYQRLGITMCDDWKGHYETFRDWALENGYNDGLEIDRIDNSLGYLPSNCRWVTKKQNLNNKSNNVKLCYLGVEHTVEDVAKMSGVDKDLIYRRLKKGLKDDDVITPPKYLGENNNQIVTVKINDKDVSLAEIAHRIGVHNSTIKRRYNKRKCVADIFEPTVWNKYSIEEASLINKRILEAKEYYMGGEHKGEQRIHES